MEKITYNVITADWAQKRFKISKELEIYIVIEFKFFLKWIYRWHNSLLSWFLWNVNISFFNFKKYLIFFFEKKRILKNLFIFLEKYHGLYKKRYFLNKKINFFFNDKIFKQHVILKFIFGSQQIFFQLFNENSKIPDTHSTVGTLIRIRENIRDHGGSYISRLEDLDEFTKKLQLYDKKHKNYFYKKKRLDNFSDIIIKKKLINTKLKVTKASKILKAKKELILKKKKSNVKLDSILLKNKRNNIKTEPIYGKYQRRRFVAWLWFIKCIVLFFKKKKKRVNEKIILSVVGIVKIFKKIIKYILVTLKKFKVVLFFLKLNLKYNGVKLKHFSTIKKKTRKKILRIEKKNYIQ